MTPGRKPPASPVPTAAKPFVQCLYTPKAQSIFAEKGYRPVIGGLAGVRKFPTPSGLFKIDKFGGWKVVKDKFFDPQKGIVAGIEQKLGVSTGSG